MAEHGKPWKIYVKDVDEYAVIGIENGEGIVVDFHSLTDEDEIKELKGFYNYVIPRLNACEPFKNPEKEIAAMREFVEDVKASIYKKHSAQSVYEEVQCAVEKLEAAKK